MTMTLHADAADHPLDHALPTALVGSGHGWFTRYRRHPVFSPAWVRGRLHLTGTVVVCSLAPLAYAVWNEAPATRPYAPVVQIAIHLLLPCLLTPWLASLVRRQGWSAVHEWRALVAVVALTVASMAAFSMWGAEPFKQWIAEQTGTLKPDGSRGRVVLLIGVSVPSTESTPPRGAPSDASADWKDDQRSVLSPPERATNALMWGLLAYALGGGTALFAWRRQRTELTLLRRDQALQRAEAERREAELKLSVLAAQVEPHFLFNTLAGVRSAIATDPARASEMIDRLVEYLRATIPRLRSDGSAEATLGGQLDMVRAYLGLMAARMPRLRYSVQAAPELLAAPCPPWMLISLVENAVRHGIEPKIGPARIDVGAVRRTDGALTISVADDGVGFGTTTSGSGLGLSNIRERLRQLYQGRATLDLTGGPAGGVIASITLPAAVAAVSTSSASSAQATPAALALHLPAAQP